MEPGDYELTLIERDEDINNIRNAYAKLEDAMLMINDAFNTLNDYNENYCLEDVEQAHDLISNYLIKIEKREEE